MLVRRGIMSGGKEIAAPPGHIPDDFKKLAKGVSERLEKTLKSYSYEVDEIYPITEIINKARVTLTVNGGGNSVFHGKGVIIKFIAEAMDGHYYSFKPYAGEPSKGKWKCVKESRNLKEVLFL